MTIGTTEVIFLASLLIFNLGSIVGSFITMKISIAKLETLVGVLSMEVDKLKNSNTTLNRGV